MQRFSSLVDQPAPVIGTWSQFANPEVIDVLGASGFQFTIVDTEHGHFGLETAENLVRACDAGGLVPLVRILTNEDYLVTKALDIGAAAVVIPRISSADETARAIRAARYGPGGARGACPCIRAGSHYVRDWRGYAADEDSPRIIALVETPEALDAIQEIVSVPGLLGLLVGPFDLSVAMGLHGDTSHPRVEQALERVVEAAARSKVPLVMPLFHPSSDDCRRKIEYWQQRGVRLFTVGTDKLLFADHCQRYLAALH